MPEQPVEIHAFPLTAMSRAYSTEERETLLKRVREVAPDPSIFDEEEPFFFGVEASNASLDSYFTHQLPSSLQNYAADFQAGVSYQDSHQWRELGLGRTLTGHYHDGRGGKLKRTTADVYTLPGLQLNRVNTDHFIRGLRSGIANDTSIGFYGGAFLCDLCGRDMLTDWECWHIPGLYYEVKGEEERAQAALSQAQFAAWETGTAELRELSAQTTWTRKKSEKEVLVLCTAGVDNAHASELSSVYDGACPGCAVQKAMREATEGRLRGRDLDLIQTRYRIALPAPRVQVPGADVKPTSDVPGVGPNGTPSPDANPDDDTRRAQILTEALSMAGYTVEGDPEEFLQTVRATARDSAEKLLSELAAAKKRVAEMETALAEHTTLVQDGQTLRKDLIDRALMQGVRAHGNAFNRALNERMLQEASLADIQAHLKEWEEAARAIFASGRVTEDTPGLKDGGRVPRQPWERRTDPDSAYRAS